MVVRGITPSFANGIRRAIIGDVPTMAIDQVDVYENTSVMFDEMISLRLGLVPLTTDLDSYYIHEECPSCGGEGCTQCEVSLTVDVEAEDESVTVYSSDLESEDPEVQPADDNIPIIDLKPGQSLVAECIARLGRGKDHAKNQGGVAVGYGHLKRVVEGETQDENIVRGVVEGPDGELVDMSEHNNKLDAAFGERVKVEDVQDAFVFKVESDG
ncbi:MAG: DNA-directed RNA polymerase subunit D, partial [Halobacteria archaeon]|nr:DNA-directed RNA polymerase subunit D [Halobacteria archaeon]